jgi:outer membrane protein OmpA-like peptidoglycan-associated protein
MKKLQLNQIVIMLSLTLGFANAGQAQSVRNANPLQIDEHAQEQQRRYDAMQSRLDKLSDLKTSSNPWDVYNLAKAQAWLDFAFDSSAQRDASNVVPEAFDEGDKLTQQLEVRAQNISLATPIIPTSMKLRDDIWKIAEDMKRHANFNCAAAKVAQFEVQLVQAGHANQQLGWRHAKPYIQASERLSKDAQVLLDKGCAKPVVAPVVIKPEPVVVPTPAPVALPTAVPIIISPEPVIVAVPTLVLPVTKQVVREVRTISDRVHFAYKSAAIAPVTATLLDQAATIMHEHPDAKLTLQGHTDKRGGNAYNMKLAKQRALNAKQYLVDAGIEAERMKVVAYGKAKPAIPPAGRKGQAFNRRVEFMVIHDALTLAPQHKDLQPRKNVGKRRTANKSGPTQ